jgi:GWxTD domain-containing protein
MRSRKFSAFGIFFVALAISLSSASFAKDETKSLSPRFRDWLKKDIVYIISNEEKNAFLQLTTDDARDKFIEHFWDIRNPNPGAPDNPYRAEHYRRLEYASQYFGHASHTEGWRTDMGRVYITLGEPQQRQKLLGLQKVTPMEIWFYSNGNPALPPFFYVVFWQRDSSSEFKIYSPYGDGPEKLITAVVGPSRGEALKILSQDAGRDVARVTLSLLPDEPVDINTGEVSLQSDVMLNTIRNLANNPIAQGEIQSRRRLLEDVSHRVILGSEYLDVATVPLRDAAGNSNLHYVLRLKKPEDLTIGQYPKGGYYYSILATAKVYGADGKLILTDERKVSRGVSQTEFEAVKSKIFGYEGWLPLPPGKYRVEFQLSNLLNNTALRKAIEVAIPDPQATTLQVSNLIPFADASMVPPESSSTLPFSGAGVKFIPKAGQELQFVQGEPLKFFYQVWTGQGLRKSDKKLQVEYVYGRMGAHDNKTIEDEIPMDQLDAAGSVINGKQIPTVDLTPGNYRLAMTIRDPETQEKAFGALTFGVFTSTNAVPAWDVSDDQIVERLKSGVLEYQRAACYLASGDKPHAMEWFEKAFTKNPSDERIRGRLVELYFEKQQYAKVAEVYSKGGINQSTDEQTITRFAESFDKSGDVRKAVAVLESGTTMKPGSGPLLLALAEYYKKTGEAQKASAAEQKGRQLMNSHPES